MAKAIKQFVVAIKADTSKYDKGVDDATSKMRGFRSTAMGVGGTVGSVLLGLGANAVAVANDMDKLGVAMRFQKVGVQYVENMGAAIQRLGGDSEEALQFITSFQDKFDQFKTLGEGSNLYKDLKVAGLNAEDFIDAQSIEELINRISDDLNRVRTTMSDEEYKKTARMIQKPLDVSTSFIEMISKGSGELANQLKQSEEYHGNIEKLVEQSRDFNLQWAIANQQLDGFKNRLAEGVLPHLTEAVKIVGDFFSKKRQDEIITNMLDEVDEFKKDPVKYVAGDVIKDNTAYEGTIAPIVKQTTPYKALNYIMGGERLKKSTIEPYTTDGVYDPSKMDYSVPMIPNVSAPKPDPSSNKMEMNAQAQINLNATFETKLDGEVIAKQIENYQSIRDLEFLESMQSTTKA